MTLEWRGRTLVITWLPVATADTLAVGEKCPTTARSTAPYSACSSSESISGKVKRTRGGRIEVLAALLAGARVRVGREALEYRRYRRTAPLGIYQKCAGLERRLREMGICVAGTGGR